MKSFPVPENIQLKDPLTEQPLNMPGGAWVSFKRWFVSVVLDDQRMGATPSRLARVMTLMGKVTVAAPGERLDLEDADYDLCKTIVENPERSMGGTVVSAQLLPFSTAFLAAETKG